jgi:L-ascorbate metabolism protein UlaG (beta-lactamase superfamily)
MWKYGKVDVRWLGHDGFVLQGSKTIIIDPFKAQGNHKADLLLISHEHYDHLSADDIKRFSTSSTKVIAPTICKEALSNLGLTATYVTPDSKQEIDDVIVETLPAYNLNKFRSPGKVFHPREDGRVGYIVTLDGTRFYHAGDADAIPEMKQVDVDVAFLPVSGTYVMTAEEAVGAAKMMKAKVVVPMHFGTIVGTKADADRFKKLASCETKIMEKE